MYLLTNIINMLYTQNFPLTELPHVLKTQTSMCNSFHVARLTHQNGVQFEIKSLLSSFIVPEDIISIRLDKNFTMNATGMVLESL